MRTKALSRFPLAMAVSIALQGLLLGLAGCSYLEAQVQRTAPPDNRIELGWQERVSARPRDIANYKCGSAHTLVCDGGGAVTLSCTCVLR